ncbi:hypothetical protein [Nocardia sp. NPDC005998]|uniref:hypothetical protein n=1 Tax=Nocardia sp. NPDC005998 TaxID=3156894 RepID=UPI0033A69476
MSPDPLVLSPEATTSGQTWDPLLPRPARALSTGRADAAGATVVPYPIVENALVQVRSRRLPA